MHFFGLGGLSKKRDLQSINVKENTWLERQESPSELAENKIGRTHTKRETD
jgi:hypothetical protein